MNLKTRINDDVKAAMRAKQSTRLATIRLLTAAIKQKEVDGRIELTDAEILTVVDKMIKQRKDSIAQFEAGGRQDLAEIEKAEIAILSEYMPAQLSQDEIKSEVTRAIAEVGATNQKDMGRTMAVLKAKLAGKADMTVVSTMVKQALTGS